MSKKEKKSSVLVPINRDIIETIALTIVERGLLVHDVYIDARSKCHVSYEDEDVVSFKILTNRGDKLKIIMKIECDGARVSDD